MPIETIIHPNQPFTLSLLGREQFNGYVTIHSPWNEEDDAEKHAFNKLLEFQQKLPSNIVYLGLPWTTLFRSQEAMSSIANAIKNFLINNSGKNNATHIITMCANPNTTNQLEVFKEFGITDLFTPFLELEQSPLKTNINIHPFPLLPRDTTKNSEKFLETADTRELQTIWNCIDASRKSLATTSKYLLPGEHLLWTDNFLCNTESFGDICKSNAKTPITGDEPNQKDQGSRQIRLLYGKEHFVYDIICLMSAIQANQKAYITSKIKLSHMQWRTAKKINKDLRIKMANELVEKHSHRNILLILTTTDALCHPKEFEFLLNINPTIKAAISRCLTEADDIYSKRFLAAITLRKITFSI